MFPLLRDDRDRLPELLRTMTAYAAEVLTRVDIAPVAAPPQAIDLASLADSGIGADAAFARFRDTVAPYLTASAGPRYFGFVTGGATPAAMVGDWLTTVFDQNPVSRLDGWAALQLEAHTVTMLRDLFGLPDTYAGTFVTGATMSNVVGLAVAREWVGRAHDVRVSEAGLAAAPAITVLAGTPHSTSLKALSILGLGRRAWRAVSCVPGREAVDVEALARELSAIDGPVIVIASAGTVNTGDFDDLAALAALKQRFGFYLHVDAAFGGFASVSPDSAVPAPRLGQRRFDLRRPAQVAQRAGTMRRWPSRGIVTCRSTCSPTSRPTCRRASTIRSRFIERPRVRIAGGPCRRGSRSRPTAPTGIAKSSSATAGWRAHSGSGSGNPISSSCSPRCA